MTRFGEAARGRVPLSSVFPTYETSERPVRSSISCRKFYLLRFVLLETEYIRFSFR